MIKTEKNVKSYYEDQIITFALRTAAIRRECALQDRFVDVQVDEILGHLYTGVNRDKQEVSKLIAYGVPHQKTKIIYHMDGKLKKYSWYQGIKHGLRKGKHALEKVPGLRSIIHKVMHELGRC